VKSHELKDKLKTVFDNSSAILPNISNFINYTYCWPKDWLSMDFHNKINIFGVNYNSILSYWDSANDTNTKNNDNTIKRRSNELINQLDLANIGKKPIVWVCHSMGGLILKQMLINLANLPNGSKIIENTKGIIFYSTPHLGSSLAKRAMHLSLALLPSKEIEDLALNNKYLKKLNEEFVSLTMDKKWKIISFCENLSTYVGYNLYVKLVSEASARLPTDLSEFIVLDKDHLYICKPDSKDSIIYKSVVNMINQVYFNYINEKERESSDKIIDDYSIYDNYFFKEFLLF
jgi:hypothetical protein